jgi:hypothetical protein
VKLPKLTAKIVADNAALHDASIEALSKSKDWKKASRRIVRAQDKLRRHANVDAWLAYLRVEEVVNERAAVETDILVKWAFEQGRQSRR